MGRFSCIRQVRTHKSLCREKEAQPCPCFRSAGGSTVHPAPYAPAGQRLYHDQAAPSKLN